MTACTRSRGSSLGQDALHVTLHRRLVDDEHLRDPGLRLPAGDELEHVPLPRVMETFMICPNICHDVPERFGIGLQFLSVVGPAQYVRPFGMADVALGLVAALISLRSPTVGWWVVATVVMIAAEGIDSMLFFWPHNTVLFVGGAAMHSVDLLRATAFLRFSRHTLRSGRSRPGYVTA
jgi:hypothetical protein